ncbi:MAG: aspartate/glutamate racemase family protein [Ferrovibrio sp.]
MHLLLLNANTSTDMTDRLVAAARDRVAAGTEISGLTGRFGAKVIATRASYAIAGHAAIDALAVQPVAADAIILACFGDPGLAALRELSAVPVIGMAEAACRHAAERVAKFSIVTGGRLWEQMLGEYVASLGLSASLASIRTLAANGGQIASDPAAAEAALLAACDTAIRRDGAELVILGGAGMVGMVERLSHRVAVPLIDGLTPALRAAEAAVAAAPVKASLQQSDMNGLSPELTALLRG